MLAAVPSSISKVSPSVHTGMGAILHPNGVAFRVWAPNADFVSVIGEFNDWRQDANPLVREEGGCWYADVPAARAGDEYRYFIRNGEFEASRIDPYAYEVTNSVGNGVIRSLDFDWDDQPFAAPALNELVIYELHVGTFAQSKRGAATFDAAIDRLDHVARLGANAIEVMPICEFAGDRSWGYNPAHPFAVEQSYGGPAGFQRFVRECHRRGMAVILDVVYNHFGPSDLDLWRFDGWSDNEGGGIYFYNDHRAHTPWGATRPDYGRPEVRSYLIDNARFWFDQYRVDGLRLDATVYIRTVRGPEDPGSDLPEGWSLSQDIAAEANARGKILIAEDLQDNDWLTRSTADGGAGFHSQWCAQFVHPVRAAVTVADDEARSMASIAQALSHTFNGDPFQRVIYSESHDEVANGKARVPHEISPDEQTGWFAKKRSTLAAALVMTAPGVPMLFQGQEFLLGDWFDDAVAVDWAQRRDYAGIVRLYRDLIDLRLNREGITRALTGSGIEILDANEETKVLAFRRFYSPDDLDEVVVVMNFRIEAAQGYGVRLAPGQWRLVFNSDWKGYDDQFGAELPQMHDVPEGGHLTLTIPPYTAVVFTRSYHGNESASS